MKSSRIFLLFFIFLLLIAFICQISKSKKPKFNLYEHIWLSPVTDVGSIPTAGVKFNKDNTGLMFLITDAPVLSDLEGWPKKFVYSRNGDRVRINYTYRSKERTVERYLILRLIEVQGRQCLIEPESLEKKLSGSVFGGFRCLVSSKISDQKWKPASYESLKEVAEKSITKESFLSNYNHTFPGK